MRQYRRSTSTLTFLVALLGSKAWAADGPAPTAPADAPEASSLESVIVTGTRVSNVKAADSSTPIQIIDSESLMRSGPPNLIQALAQQVPSLNAEAFGGDTANLTLSARLRGLSANHALVLVNGKRRHPTANLHVLGGAYQGAAAADLDLIPVSSIARIEVLQDGAAAQYGTDAIAGVVNIILKKDAHGISLGTTGGQYLDGGGETKGISGSLGFEPTAHSHFTLAAETRHHDYSDRSGPDARLTNAAASTPISGGDGISTWGDISGYPYLNHIFGDSKYTLTTVTLNGGADLSDQTEIYTLATYGHRNASAYENYRTPNRLPTIYPLGFNPRLTLIEDDFALTAGIKGRLAGEWHWDLSSTYGEDQNEIGVADSGNISLFTDTGFTPTQFHAGDFISSQWTSNFDVTRAFNAGLAKPLSLALGVEQRHEEFEIQAGDAASRYKAGSQSYPGFSPTDAGAHSRNNLGAYADLALSPIDQLNLDVAARFEHYSDFGNTAVGKLTARYNFTPAFALRGTLSTGFRAPTLAEEYYSATNVSPTSANVQLPPNSTAAKIIGVDDLKNEKSRNYSIGLVFLPVKDLHLTLDAYQIDIDDRIVGSGTIYGVGGAINSPAVVAAIAANGNSIDPTVTFVGVQFFTNGLDTRTRGAELAMDYLSDLETYGRVQWSLTANYNKTEITGKRATPTPVQPQGLFDLVSDSYLETASPKYKAVLGALYSWDKLSVNVREKFYGQTAAYTTPDGGAHYYLNNTGTALLTDLELGYELGTSTAIAVGANNLFNAYPDKRSPESLGVPGVALYPSFSPYGINGGYWYGRLTFSF